MLIANLSEIVGKTIKNAKTVYFDQSIGLEFADGSMINIKATTNPWSYDEDYDCDGNIESVIKVDKIPEDFVIEQLTEGE